MQVQTNKNKRIHNYSKIVVYIFQIVIDWIVRIDRIIVILFILSDIVLIINSVKKIFDNINERRFKCQVKKKSKYKRLNQYCTKILALFSQ